MTTIADAGLSCCGKKPEALQPQKVGENEKLHVEMVENDFYISTEHPMEREHYISFAETRF